MSGSADGAFADRGWLRLPTSFWILWASSTAANAGDGLRIAALPLLAAMLAADPLGVTVVAAALHLPWLVFGLPGGAIVDRRDPRRMIQLGQFARVTALGLLIAATALDVATIPLLIVAAFVMGASEILIDTAAQAILPRLVPIARLESANGKLGGSLLVTNEMAGPPIGSFLFALAPAVPFAVDAALSLVSAAFARAIPDVPASGDPSGRAGTRISEDIVEGLRWLWGNDVLRRLALVAALANFGLAAVSALLVLYVLQVLELDAATFGIFLATLAIGGLLGVSLAARVVEKFGRLRTLSMSLSIAGVAAILLGLLPHPVLSGLFLVGLGFASGVMNIVLRSLRQAVTPGHLLGRITASFRLIGLGGMPVAALLAGAAATTVGLQAPFIIAGLVIISAALAAGTRLDIDSVAQNSDQ